MKGGRKNLQRASEQHISSIEDGHSIMQVVSIRGSNLIEVMDAQGEKSLALFPAKFQKSMWIKRGSFVVVDESGKKNALESGSKVACIVSRVLYFEQVRELQKSPEWPEIFKNAIVGDQNENLQAQNNRPEEDEVTEVDSSDDDGLPPLEANTNRTKPLILQPDTESESDSDS
ncbi:probable RNA-binding protein EIF1AD isoform X1 [Benincasa hispida]|uniref:probable RNA-binding protein EIF1AD isoform X1 n=2 Tax=Benincasa hispida TaxID=102211 RepID=UPI00190032DD|nr:probable RNA-binding protein EIF1AD isoform X1 [Benincasa hispida]